MKTIKTKEMLQPLFVDASQQIAIAVILDQRNSREVKQWREMHEVTEKELAEGTVQKNVAEIIVEKNRSGSTGVVKLYFKGENTRFINFNEESGEIEDGEQTQNVTVKLADCEDLPPRQEEQKEPTPISDVVKTVDDDIF